MISTHSSITQQPEEPQDVEVGYSSRVLVQALFPYKRQDTEKIVLSRGPMTYTISSTAGLPYGRYPRLLLAYLSTQAVKRRGLPEDEGRRIPLGSSLREFFTLIGMDHRVRGGTRGSITLLREQLNRLAHTSITIERRWKARDQMRNMFLAENMDVSFSTSAAEGQDTLEPSHIELSLPFWRELVTHRGRCHHRRTAGRGSSPGGRGRCPSDGRACGHRRGHRRGSWWRGFPGGPRPAGRRPPGA